MLVSELIKQLQSMEQSAEVVADIWGYDEIRNASEDHESLSDDQCRVVINYLYRNLDSEHGINNERVIRIVDNLFASGEI